MKLEVVIDNRHSTTRIWEWLSDLDGFQGGDDSVITEKWELAVHGLVTIKLLKLSHFSEAYIRCPLKASIFVDLHDKNLHDKKLWGKLDTLEALESLKKGGLSSCLYIYLNYML